MKKIIYLTLTLTSISFLLSGCDGIEEQIEKLNQIELTEVAVQNSKIYLIGFLNSKSYNQIKSAIRKNPNAKTIVLTANPGSLDDETTFKLARYIRNQGLNTHLLSNSVIASGAVDLFLSGVNRTIEKGAKLGVHSWSDGSKQAKDFPRNHPDHRLNADYIKDMIGSEDLYWFTIYSAPADAIYWMRDEEIIKYKITTNRFLKASNDKPPFNQKFLIEREDILRD